MPTAFTRFVLSSAFDLIKENINADAADHFHGTMVQSRESLPRETEPPQYKPVALNLQRYSKEANAGR